MDFWHDSAVQKRWLLRLTLFIGLLLVPVFVLAVFARPSADDYIYAARTHAVMQQYGFDLPRLLKAAWDTNVYYFENWQGLYVSGFLLAWQPAGVQASIIDELQWERATPTTISNAQQLREELGRIRARGWSFDNGEDYPDVRCVAAPVFNANNDLTAAISVVGTRLQINEDNRDYLAGKAIACAKDISRLLGWKSPFEQLASS